jgi:low affinity Fe/Cu permease
MKIKKMQLSKAFDKFSRNVTKAAGSYWAFIGACMVVIVWGICGPIFHYSENWQLVINTGTTIITFLMVFVIQQSSNKDTLAIHIKLDEILRAQKEANNNFRNIEDKTQEELNIIKKQADENCD